MILMKKKITITKTNTFLGTVSGGVAPVNLITTFSER